MADVRKSKMEEYKHFRDITIQAALYEKSANIDFAKLSNKQTAIYPLDVYILHYARFFDLYRKGKFNKDRAEKTIIEIRDYDLEIFKVYNTLKEETNPSP